MEKIKKERISIEEMRKMGARMVMTIEQNSQKRSYLVFLGVVMGPKKEEEKEDVFFAMLPI